MTKRCQMPAREVDHDAPRLFGATAYAECRKPAAWFVGETDIPACEDCTRDALLYRDDVAHDRAGDRVSVDTDGELVPA